MNWINYLLEANLYLALFYVVYYLMFRKETYYQLNRIYLLSSSALAFIIPILQLGFLKPVPVPVNTNFDAMPGSTVAVERVTAQSILQPHVTALNINYYFLVYTTVALILTFGLAVRLFQLFKLAKRGNRYDKQGFRLIEIDDDDRAFSFFNYLFIGKGLATSPTIIQHELVHIRQRHSFDIIYLELLKIICWFNPFVYLLQYSIKEIHEFIADSHISVQQQNVNEYTDFLIGNAYGLSETSLTNNFFNNKLLKNRIIMLHQERSGSLVRLKYLAALPLVVGMLCISTLGFTKDYTVIDLAPGGHLHNDGSKPAPIKIQYKTPPPPPAPPTTASILNKTAKGFEYEESGYLVKGKADFRVIITEKNGEQKAYFRNSASKADLKILNDKYGYTFPTIPLHDKMPPPPPAPAMINDSKTAVPSVNNKVVSPYDSLYKQFMRNFKYPREARDKHIQGRVFVEFDVDNNNKAGIIKVIRSPDDALSKEVIKTLSSINPLASVKQGVTYVLPINFALSGIDSTTNKNEVSQPQDNKADLGGIPGPHHDQQVDLNEIAIIAQATN